MARPFKTQRAPQLTQRRPKTNFTKIETDPNAPAEPTQRLHKLLALAGLGSRRDMEALIANGRVTINGQMATQGAGVTQYDVVRVDSRPVKLPFESELPQVLIYHKPEGEIVSQDDPEGRASVFDKLPKVKHAKWIAIGRLDLNTSGLLIFTTSGDLANRFMHPRYEVEREYAVRIFGELTEGQIAQLKEGIELDDGPAKFDGIIATGGEGANHWYQVVLREGRNREVRRMFEAFQLPVSRLMRVRFGPVNLPPRVKRGQMLKLEQKEVVGLLEWAELAVPKAPLRQLTQREKLKATTVFMPKVRKQRGSLLDYQPAERALNERESTRQPFRKQKAKVISNERNETSATTRQPDARNQPAPKTYSPKKPTNRRVRQSSDLIHQQAKTGARKSNESNANRQAKKPV